MSYTKTQWVNKEVAETTPITAEALNNIETGIEEAHQAIDTLQNEKEAKPNYLSKTANYTAVANDFIYINTTAASFTITLPATPSANDKISFLDIGGTLETNPLTIDRNGQTIMGLAENLTADVNYTHFEIIYNGTDWRIL